MIIFISAAILGLPFWILLWLFAKYIRFKASLQYYCFSFVGFMLFVMIIYSLVRWNEYSTYSHPHYGIGIGWEYFFYFLLFFPLIIPLISVPHVTINYFLTKTRQRTGIWNLLKPIFVVTLGIAIILLVQQFTK